MKKYNHWIAIVACVVLVVANSWMIWRIWQEYQTAATGPLVACKVQDASAVCVNKNKQVIVQYQSKTYKVKLYGTACREKEFVPQSTVLLHWNPQQQWLVPEGNAYAMRFTVNGLLFLLPLIILIIYLRQFKTQRPK